MLIIFGQNIFWSQCPDAIVPSRGGSKAPGSNRLFHKAFSLKAQHFPDSALLLWRGTNGPRTRFFNHCVIWSMGSQQTLHNFLGASGVGLSSSSLLIYGWLVSSLAVCSLQVTPVAKPWAVLRASVGKVTVPLSTIQICLLDLCCFAVLCEKKRKKQISTKKKNPLPFLSSE